MGARSCLARRTAAVARVLRRASLRVPAGAGAIVMGTGVVSLDLSIAGERIAALAFLAFAALEWLLIAAALVLRVLRERPPLRDAPPTVLSTVAATDVLGASLLQHGAGTASAALLALALLLWLLLAPSVLADAERPPDDAAFLLAISTGSLAVLAASLGGHEHLHWLVIGSLAPLGLGGVLYLLVLVRYDLRHLRSASGDHWMAGGALAIAALAAGQAALAARELHVPALNDWLEFVAVAVWVLSVAWLPALIASEALWPRLSYDLRRWSTVFPLGMYAACSFVVGRAAHLPALQTGARVWVWVAVTAWAAVCGAMLRRGVIDLRALSAR
jgi:hypothetical protein